VTTGADPGIGPGTGPLRSLNPDEIFSALPGEPSVAWVRHGEGLIGWGVAAREHFLGEERFSRAQRWFAEWSRANNVRDRLPTGSVDTTLAGSPVASTAGSPVAFASFTFDDETPGSVVVIPQTLLTVREGRAWITEVRGAAPLEGLVSAPPSASAAPKPHWRDQTAEEATWTTAVTESVKRIAAGELDKVVLAREVSADFDTPVDLRQVLARLAQRYPQCWTFNVDGLVGATPELLVRRFGDKVSSRVLAGTVRSSGSARANARSAKALRGSAKDLAEHEYAVRSVAHSLAIHCTDLQVAEDPSVLPLANVQHLATDISAHLADGSSALALAASLHPTAAVCGTPTERAMVVISEMENLNRRRYSGPVGWFDATGDGEFGIALRCAEISDDRLRARLFAGCGLVADSEPSAELAESNAKLDAMRRALDIL
jgi:menaquinone-specific isochorismate synthase